jgi:hypothetical protein
MGFSEGCGEGPVIAQRAYRALWASRIERLRNFFTTETRRARRLTEEQPGVNGTPTQSLPFSVSLRALRVSVVKPKLSL